MTLHNWVKKYEEPVACDVYRYKCIRCGIEAYGLINNKIEPFHVDAKDDCDLQIIDSINRS